MSLVRIRGSGSSGVAGLSLWYLALSLSWATLAMGSDCGPFEHCFALSAKDPPPSSSTCDPTATQEVRTVVDFEEDADGNPLERGARIFANLTLPGGISLEAQRTQKSGPFQNGMIFDTNTPGGRDFDLVIDPEKQGNIFIISADDDSSDPDDAGQGGTIRVLSNHGSITLESIVVVDAEGGATFDLFGLVNGTAEEVLLDSFHIPSGKIGNSESLTILFRQPDVVKVVIDLGRAGAIDDIIFSRAVPIDCDDTATAAPTGSDIPGSAPAPPGASAEPTPATFVITPAPTIFNFDNVVPAKDPAAVPTASPVIVTPLPAAPSEAPSVCVETVVISFEVDAQGNPLPAGTFVDSSVLFEGGVTVRARKSTRTGVFDDGMIFDTRNPTGNDADLVGDGKRDNIVIISANDDQSNPDDAGVGGSILVDFPRAVLVQSLTLVDVEEEGVAVTLKGPGGVDMEVLSIPAGGVDGAQTLLEIQRDGVRRISIRLNGSGGLDDVTFTMPCARD